MSRVLLAVDLSYQCYRAAAAHPMLTSRRVFTGGLYGFLTTLGKMVRETKATEVAICADRKPYLRSLTYPQYKQIRKASADEELLKMFKQTTSLVLDFLAVANIPVWGLEGFESDDLIGHAGIKYRHRYKMIYAGSNDSDLYQLLWIPNFAIYTKDITSVVTGESVMRKHGMTPEQYAHSTALTGTHNDIEGIEGVGPVTARKAVLDPFLMRAIRAKHSDLIDRNRNLIKLPHADLPHDLTIPALLGPLDMRSVYRWCGRYDIEVTSTIEQALKAIHGH